MVVCHCNVVSDRESRSAIAAGALDAAGLAARCGAGSRCGGCQPMVEAILHEASVLIRSAAA
ncbi:MAG: (2Fe-2S)-binding protein [Aquihabitans sp.]